MNLVQRLRNWTMRLPNRWGLGQAEIHSSLFMLLGLLSFSLLLTGFSRPGLAELLPAAVTLPVVWVVSLTVRVAAQQLALGPHAQDAQTTVGPAGNLATDYEYLPPRQMFVYSLAGQLATLGLALLGFVIHAAMVQASPQDLRLALLLDFEGGWGSVAWASQILWVNIFLAVLHLLPTVPFDMRATIFAWFSLSSRSVHEPHVFRQVATLVSHLSTFMLGVGLTWLVLGSIYQREIVGWYAAIAAAVYLWVARQWESSRADELETQYTRMPTPSLRRAGPHAKRPHLKLDSGAARPRATSVEAQPQVSGDESVADLGEPQSAAVDIDEILRKLHRQGRGALSSGEQQALLSASRQLQEKRSLGQ